MAPRTASDVLDWRSAHNNELLRPDAPSFMPATIPAPTLGRKSVPCRFFLMGTCNKGVTCPFRHEALIHKVQVDDQSLKRAEQSVAQLSVADLLPNVDSKHSEILDASIKNINGAFVRFSSGAEVADVKFASDYSTIQIFGLPINAQAEFVLKLLKGLGFSVPQSCVQLKSLGNAELFADVKVEDANFAKAAANKFDEESRRGEHRGLSVKPVSGDIGRGSLANRLRMSSVICTWYAASRVAWLQYRNLANASRAQIVLNANPKILGRRIECTIQHPPPYARPNPIWSIQVGNLDVLTNEIHFNKILTGANRPHKVVLGRPSHSFSETAAAEKVESVLRSKGDLESFQFHAVPGSVKLKATATFMDRGQAAEAVRSLNNQKLEKLGNSKLFVGHIISVKYSVLNVIYISISGDLGRLRDSIWQSGHVHLKSYPSLDIMKPLTTLRVFGEDSKRVAEAKSALEKILAGSVVMNGETAVWDPFFATTGALDYLKQKSIDHQLYIHRDIRKSHLLLYGGSVNDQAATKQSLISKVESLQHLAHTIVLTSELLPKAMKGGWRRIREQFGDVAVLDISRHPKTILIRGSLKDFQQAQALLQAHFTSTDSEVSEVENKCPVCWEEANNPLKMTCGHKYCKECFSLQLSSADHGSFPIRCCGGEGENLCLRIFSLEELESMLSLTALERLLATSFDAFVRKHPETFQHCPTPDCPSIYRMSTDGTAFICSACLTPICTACNVISHDGMSCAEFKDLSSEGTEALEKWKKENDVRPCPKCSSPIEKNFGCNHMTCFHCKAHICWFCMRVFQGSVECYNHMGAVH